MRFDQVLQGMMGIAGILIFLVACYSPVVTESTLASLTATPLSTIRPLAPPLLPTPTLSVIPTPGLAEQLEAAVPQLREQYQVPGVAIGLVHHGAVGWVQGYGWADREETRSVSHETVFQVASISKPVSAWGVMRLVERGELVLDGPVAPYLTRWHLPPSEFDPQGVTIRRLLSHTAGLSLHGYPGFAPEHPLPTLEESLAGLTGGVGDVRLIREPGSGYAYSGGGYTLLQLVIEEVTGEPFVDFMAQEVLGPLGMTRSSFAWRPALRATTARAYDAAGQALPNYLFTAQAAAGLYTTAADLARFVAASVPGPHGEPVGRGVLTPETLAVMFMPAPATAEGYGLGYMLGALSDRTRLVWHDGSNRGWQAQIAVVPARGEGIVLLTNSDSGAELIRDVMALWIAWLEEGEPAAASIPLQARRSLTRPAIRPASSTSLLPVVK